MTTKASHSVTITLTDTVPHISRRESIWALVQPQIEHLELQGESSSWLTIAPLTPNEVNTTRVLLTRYAQEHQADERSWRFKTRYHARTQTLYVCKVINRPTPWKE